VTKAQVKKTVKELQEKLKLTHYEIKLTFKKENEDNFKVAAEISISRDYLRARLTIYDCAFDKENDMEHIIKHELCHIITEPLYLYCFDLLNGKLRTSQDIEEQREMMTEKIARLV
jgi:predicted SprT family Zn-dependent metalloprotease